jgi:hypothetical protein
MSDENGDSWKLKMCLALLSAIIPIFIGLITYVVRDIKEDIKRVEVEVIAAHSEVRGVHLVQVQRVEQFELMLVRMTRVEVLLDAVGKKVSGGDRYPGSRYGREEEYLQR